MDRRDLLRAFGAATTLALLPYQTVEAWARVAELQRGTRLPRGLTDAQLAFVSAVADTILPRSDSPGATDVGVPAFVDVIVSENYDDAERAAFVAGLVALDALARSSGGSSFAELVPDARGQVLAAIEGDANHHAEPAHTYWRLKGLVIHGYFTSEQVMKDVLRVQIIPGKFDGAAPMPLRRAPPPPAPHGRSF